MYENLCCVSPVKENKIKFHIQYKIYTFVDIRLSNKVKTTNNSLMEIYLCLIHINSFGPISYSEEHTLFIQLAHYLFCFPFMCLYVISSNKEWSYKHCICGELEGGFPSRFSFYILFLIHFLSSSFFCKHTKQTAR